MGSPKGMFKPKEVEHLSKDELLKLRLQVIEELLEKLPDVKLRDELAKKYKIKTRD